MDQRSANLAGLVAAAAAARSQRPALLAGGIRWTWAELDAVVDAAAAGLRAADLRIGDRVALLTTDAVGFIRCYLGALRAGLVAVPLDHSAAGPEVAAALTETGARLLIADPGTEPTARAGAAAGGARLAVIGSAGPDGLDALLAGGRPGPLDPPGSGGEAIAVLLQTAGTGGRPKRAMLSHRALLANLDQCAALDPAPVTAADTVLLALPLFHVFGLNAVLGQALHAGAAVVVATDPDPAATLTLIANERVTSVAGTPSTFAAWAGEPAAAAALRGVRVLVSGSAPMRPEAAEAFRAATGKPVWQGYGLTEAAPVVSASMRPVPGSVGAPLPGIEIRLLDADGAPVAEGDPGELWIRGANLFSGYWPDRHDGPGPDGWFATGDVGWSDPDGNLFMVSTRSDVIVVSGFTVYPGEVEDVVAAMPGVREAAVVAVPDEGTGQAVKLFVVGEAALDIDAVREWCAARLGRFKVPRQVEFVAELPRSVAGKIARGRLRDAE
ncbi:MAG TPA: AMP-binding protein [Sporichthyaceae bacterium]